MKNNEILKLSYNESINNIKHFLNIININPEAFNHLYNIDISIEDFINNREIAYYYHDQNNNEDSNRISINRKYIEDTKSKLKDKDKIIEEVSSSITHEILHSNRCISICNGNEYFENLPYMYGKLNNERNALEEIITETLNIYILLCKNKDTFNINELNKELLRYARSNNKILLEVGYLLFDKYKEELIYSFILSSYNEIYIDNMINKIVSNKDLLYNISNIYYEYIDNNSKDRNVLKRIKNTL